MKKVKVIVVSGNNGYVIIDEFKCKAIQRLSDIIYCFFNINEFGDRELIREIRLSNNSMLDIVNVPEMTNNQKELNLDDLKLQTLNVGEMMKLRRRYNIPENPHTELTAKLCCVISALEKDKQKMLKDIVKEIRQQILSCESLKGKKPDYELGIDSLKYLEEKYSKKLRR